ncbi:MAG: chromosome partitioning protein ParB [Crocinitomicaceae bacterium]|nr:chromosome partitioning protein ParB [Crocinitomicaceae bacterium]
MTNYKTTKRSALGKGLSALLENSDINNNSKRVNNLLGTISNIPISSIEENPFNPRTNFEKEPLTELSNSIMEHGIIQPLTVRELGRGKYQLISGERRLRASKIAGLKTVPVYIMISNDQKMLEMALVENIQRENLNPIEIGLSYSRLIKECNLTQEKLSEKISKSRSNIANHIRLLKLPIEIQSGVKSKKISMGHARALISINNQNTQINLFNRIVSEKLSVRDLESILRQKKTSALNKENKKNESLNRSKNNQSDFILKEYLSSKLSTKIDIKKSKKGNGKIIINFNSNKELNRIIELFKK